MRTDNPEDLFVVALDPVTMTFKSEFESQKRAADAFGLSRQAVHIAIRDGTLCAGYRWMKKPVFETWKRSFEQGRS